MRAHVFIPTLGTDEFKIATRRFAARQDDNIRISGHRLARAQHGQLYSGFLRQRIEIIKVGQTRQPEADHVQTARPARCRNIKRVFGRQFPSVLKPRHHTKSAPSGVCFDHPVAIRKKRRIAPKTVDDEPADQRRILSVNHSLGANDLGNDAAAIDVTGQDHGAIACAGEAHVGDITNAQIDLSRAACPFDKDQIILRFQPVETVQHSLHQRRFHLGIIAGFHRRHPLALHHDLRTDIGFRLEKNRVHVRMGRQAASHRLQGLRAPDLSAIRGDGGIVRHVLRLERRN